MAYLIPVPKGDTGKGSPEQDLGFGVLRTPFHMGFVTPENATCVNPLSISYVLFTLVGIAQRLGIDTEQALRTSNDKFERRFTKVESLAQERKLELTKLELAELDAIWDEVKNSEHS